MTLGMMTKTEKMKAHRYPPSSVRNLFTFSHIARLLSVETTNLSQWRSHRGMGMLKTYGMAPAMNQMAMARADHMFPQSLSGLSTAEDGMPRRNML